MLRHTVLLLFLFAWITVSGQERFITDTQIKLENCSFDDEDASRYNCYSKVLYDLFVEELNNYYASLSLRPGDVLQNRIDIRLSPEGEFQLKSIDTDNEKVRTLVENRVKKMERVLPVKNQDSDDEFGDFSMMFAFHMDDENKLQPGLPKQTVGGFDDLVKAVDFEVIEQVPIYPGCKGNTNEELKKCMSQKVQELVIKNFDVGLATKLGLPAGIKRVYLHFKINKEVNVADIQARAEHPALGEEAKRVVKLIPQMEPGRQKGKVVGVQYALPIVFKVEETNKERRERLKREREAKKKNKS